MVLIRLIGQFPIAYAFNFATIICVRAHGSDVAAINATFKGLDSVYRIYKMEHIKTEGSIYCIAQLPIHETEGSGPLWCVF